MSPMFSLLIAVSFVGTSVLHAARFSEDPQWHEIVGIVTDIANAPVPDAEVTIVKPVGFDGNTRTAKDGRFIIRKIPGGQISLKVRRLGYEVRTVDLVLDKDLSTSLEVMLKPVPAELEAITVIEEEKLALREYYEHKSQRSSYAKFFDGKDITKRGASNISDMFRNVPSVAIRASSSGGNSVRIRGCQPMVWVDGQRIPGSEVDDVVSPGDVAGLEFYPSMAGLPAQYLDRSTRACGSILVWTKNR